MERRQAEIAAQNRQAASRPTIVAGGGGPHPPDMEARVATLEADMKDVKAAVQRIELTLAELKPTILALPTKADVATSAGVLGTLAEKVGGLDKRLDIAERTISGKVMGPIQLPAIVVGTAAALAALAAGYHWLFAQPWFLHP